MLKINNNKVIRGNDSDKTNIKIQSTLYLSFQKIAGPFTLISKKLINKIIKKLDFIAITVKNSEVNNLVEDKANETDKNFAKTTHFE